MEYTQNSTNLDYNKIHMWAEIWMKCFKYCIGNQRGYKMRLQELEEWDKPLSQRNDAWEEYFGKIQALEILTSRDKS